MTLLWHMVGRPPQGHIIACLMMKQPEQLSQNQGKSVGSRPYWRQRLSANLKMERSVPFRWEEMAVSQAPVLQAWVVGQVNEPLWASWRLVSVAMAVVVWAKTVIVHWAQALMQ